MALKKPTEDEVEIPEVDAELEVGEETKIEELEPETNLGSEIQIETKIDGKWRENIVDLAIKG